MTRPRPRLAPIALLLALAPAALAADVASAAPKVDGEFALPATPVHLAQGPDGNIWVALSGGTDDVAKVTPQGVVTGYDLGPGIMGTAGITTGPDGNLWATHAGGVFRFAPANPTAGTDVAVAQITDARPIVVGPDGNLWTASAANAIKITPDAVPVATPFPVAGMVAHDIARGGDGKLYIADGSGRVVGLTTTGTPTFYATGGNLQGIAAGPGTQIAFTDPVNAPEQIGRITPGNPTPLLTDQPNIDPTGIVLGADGAYWIANFGGNTLSRFTTDGKVTTLTGLSAASGPRYITSGPGHTLWVGLETAQKVARVTGVEAPPAPGPAPSPTPQPRLVLSSLSLPERVRVGTRTTIRLTLSDDATIALRFDRRLPGRRTKRGRCVAPTRRLRNAHHCIRFRKAGVITRRASAGRVKISFAGRIGGHALAPGSYRLTIAAQDAAAKPLRATFTIVAARKHRAHR